VVTAEKHGNVVCGDGCLHGGCTRMGDSGNGSRVVGLWDIISVGAGLDVGDNYIPTFVDVPPQGGQAPTEPRIANCTRSHVNTTSTLPKIYGNTVNANGRHGG